MVVQLLHFTLPLAAVEAMSTVDTKFVQHSLETLVGHGSEARLVTQWTWLIIYTLDTHFTIVVSAAVDEVRLAKDI